MTTFDPNRLDIPEDSEDWMHKDDIKADSVTYFQMVFYPTVELPVDKLAKFLAARLFEWNELANNDQEMYESIRSPLQTAILPSPEDDSEIVNCLMLRGVSYGFSLSRSTPEGFQKWLLSKNEKLAIVLSYQVFGIESRGLTDRHRHLSAIKVKR